jgi:hypothetical protein
LDFQIDDLIDGMGYEFPGRMYNEYLSLTMISRPKELPPIEPIFVFQSSILIFASDLQINSLYFDTKAYQKKRRISKIPLASLIIE